jgi:hypothetical protein
MLSKVSFPVAEESGALGAPVVSPFKTQAFIKYDESVAPVT